MATHAIIEIIGNEHLWFDKFAFYKHHDGYPVGMAARLEELVGKNLNVGGYGSLPDAKSDYPWVPLVPETFMHSDSRFEPLRLKADYNLGQKYHYIIDIVNNQISSHQIDLRVDKAPNDENRIAVQSINSFIEQNLFSHPDYIDEAKAHGIDPSNQRIIPLECEAGSVVNFALSNNLLFEAQKLIEKIDSDTSGKNTGNLSHYASQAWKFYATCADAGVKIENAEQVSEKFKSYATHFANSYNWNENRPGGLEDASKQWGNTFYCRRGFDAFDLSPGTIGPRMNAQASVQQDADQDKPVAPSI